jgi:CHAT domain-containing protein/tetratricopeptide (TPR) repeat protein
MSISCLKINNPLYTLLVALCFPLSLLSQSPDTIRMNEQLDSAHLYVEQGNVARASVIANQLLQELESEKYYAIQAELQWILADIALVKGDMELAEFWLDSAYCLLHNALPWQHPEIADALSHLGNYYFEKGYLPTAYRYHTEAVQIRLALYGEQHPITAKSYNNLGNCFLSAGDYEQARAFYQLVIGIHKSRSENNLAELASAYNNLGNVYLALGQMNVALQYYRETLMLRKEKYGEEHMQTARVYQNIGNCLLALKKADSSLYYFRRTAGAYEAYYPEQHAMLADVYENMGNALMYKLDYSGAWSLLNKALSIRLGYYQKGHPSIVRSYQNIGEYWLQRGDYQSALYYFRQAISLLEDNGIDYSPQFAQVEEQLGLALLNSGQKEEAISHLRIALVMRESLFGSTHPFLAGTALNLGNAYWQAEDWSTARYYYQQALLIWEAFGSEWQTDQLNTHLNIAYTYLEEELPETALDVLIQGEAYLSDDKLVLANYYRCKAEAYSAIGGYEKAEHLFTDVLSLLSYSAGEQSLIPSVDSLLALESRARNLLLWYQTDRTVDLMRGLEYYEEAIVLFKQLQNTFFNPEARRQLSAVNHDLFEGAISTCFTLAEKDDDPTYFQKAFTFSEYNKSTRLLTSRYEYMAEEETTTDSLQLALQHVMSTINLLEKERATWSDINRKREIDQEIVDAQQVLSQLFSEWNKRNIKTVSIENIPVDSLCNSLNVDEALISFFQAKTAVYIFILTPQELSGFILPESVNWEQKVLDMGRSILAYATASTLERERLDSAYTVNAVAIHEALFGTIQTALTSIDRLIIIPDGLFSCLPFEALLTSRPGQKQRYRSYPYLLHDYEMSYSYSATYWFTTIQADKRKRKGKKSCLAVAPDYQDHPKGLSPLAFNMEEVAIVNSHLGGDLLTKDKATKSNFLAAASEYSILHLAAHAKSNPIDGDYSFLAFTHHPSDSIIESFLYAKELYSQSWDAELAVLSACETGMGSFQAGEGIISLGRAFAQAGVNSTINSLWPINDARTAQLMSGFYEQLGAHHTKSEALRKAKFDFLAAATHERAHPFYWASYLPYGDMTALDVSSPAIPLWLLISGGLLAGILLVYVFGFRR